MLFLPEQLLLYLQHITLNIPLKLFAVHLYVNFLFCRYLSIDPLQELPHSLQRKIDLLDTSMPCTMNSTMRENKYHEQIDKKKQQQKKNNSGVHTLTHDQIIKKLHSIRIK